MEDERRFCRCIIRTRVRYGLLIALIVVMQVMMTQRRVVRPISNHYVGVRSDTKSMSQSSSSSSNSTEMSQESNNGTSVISDVETSQNEIGSSSSSVVTTSGHMNSIEHEQQQVRSMKDTETIEKTTLSFTSDLSPELNGSLSVADDLETDLQKFSSEIDTSSSHRSHNILELEQQQQQRQSTNDTTTSVIRFDDNDDGKDNNKNHNNNNSLVVSSEMTSTNLTTQQKQQDEEQSRPPWAALCAVMRDEDRYIDEWVDYHLAIGFEHIYIYDSHPNYTLHTWYQNRIQSEYITMMDSNTTTTTTTTTNITSTTSSRIHLTNRILPDQGKVQEIVYGECLETLRELSDPPKWVMVLDGDEFLVIRDYDKYPSVIEFFSEHVIEGSVQINWIVLGTSNQTAYRDVPVTKRFQYIIPGFTETKAVAILDHVVGWRVHYAYHKPGYNSIGIGGRKVGVAGAMCCIRNGDVSQAAIYHYKFKSYEEFFQKQCVRGDIYKFIQKSCPPEPPPVPGEQYDDSAWKALLRLLPEKYSAFDDNNNDNIDDINNNTAAVLDETPFNYTKLLENLGYSELLASLASKKSVDDSAAAADDNTNTSEWAALCAVMSGEDRYVDEWVDYHLAIGFEHVYIYDTHPNYTLNTWYQSRFENRSDKSNHDNNNSSTASSRSRIHLNHRILSDTKPKVEIVYGECLETLRTLPEPPKWVMVLDGDEFLVIRNHTKYPSVIEFFTEHVKKGSVQISWIVMGTSHELTYRNAPVTQRFQYSIPGFTESRAVAVLNHITGWKLFYAHHKPGYNSIGMGGRKVGIAGAMCCIRNGDISEAAVYHYKFKSVEEYNQKKCFVNKSGEKQCPPEPEPGWILDDSAWKAVLRLLPEYRHNASNILLENNTYSSVVREE